MYGENPIYINKDGRKILSCETCGKPMKLMIPDETEAQSAKITNRCEGVHNGEVKLEPCYYCHLQQHHLNLKPQKS